MTASPSTLDGLFDYGLHFICVWALGLALGWLLPKPKWVQRGLTAKQLLLSSPPGLWVRRGLLCAHAAVIVREVWRNLYVPGTFRGLLRNLWRTLTTGQRLEWPQLASPAAAQPASLVVTTTTATAIVAPVEDNWYVGEQDLAEFKWTIDQNGRPKGASDWEPMMEKQWPGCTYTAWRRTLPNGKSEYKSVTLSENATPEEYMDFYLDDEARMKWDSMICETQLLESSGDPSSRREVVRWLRTFPFAFLSQREYVIARRFFREADGSLYAVTRGLVEHPAAPPMPGCVRMEGFHSHWRSRSVPCPHGSGNPAVETTLLHFEDFRINERLAKFTVRHGMAGFVKGMIPAVQRFVEERRQRCLPYAEDPASFGHRQLSTPVLPPRPAPAPAAALQDAAGGLTRYPSELSTASYSSESGCSLEDSASERSVIPRSTSMRRLGAMMLASGVAIAIARTAAPPASNGGSGRPSGKRHGSGGLHSSQHHSSKHHGSHSHSKHHHQGRRHDAPRSRRRQQEPAELAAMQA